jgi:hypothetical protein
MGRRWVELGDAEGDQGVQEGGGHGPTEPVAGLQLQPVGHRLGQAGQADVDPGGQAEQQAQDPQTTGGQRFNPGAAAQERRPGDAMAPGG